MLYVVNCYHCTVVLSKNWRECTVVRSREENTVLREREAAAAAAAVDKSDDKIFGRLQTQYRNQAFARVREIEAAVAAAATSAYLCRAATMNTCRD